MKNSPSLNSTYESQETDYSLLTRSQKADQILVRINLRTKDLGMKEKEALKEQTHGLSDKKLIKILQELDQISQLNDTLVSNKRYEQLITMIQTNESLGEIEELVNKDAISGKIKGAMDLILLNDWLNNPLDSTKEHQSKNFENDGGEIIIFKKNGGDVKLFDLSQESEEYQSKFLKQFLFSWENQAYDNETWLRFANENPTETLKYVLYWSNEPYAYEIVEALANKGVAVGLDGEALKNVTSDVIDKLKKRAEELGIDTEKMKDNANKLRKKAEEWYKNR